MRRHVDAHLHVDGHQHGGRKPAETSVTAFCYKRVNLSLEELKNVTIILYSKTRTIQIAEFPEVSHLLNQNHMSLARHVNATSCKSLETMFGRKVNKNNEEQYPERKLNFTLLFAKYYLYNAKLTHGVISMFDFIAKLNHKYPLEGLNV